MTVRHAASIARGAQLVLAGFLIACSLTALDEGVGWLAGLWGFLAAVNISLAIVSRHREKG